MHERARSFCTQVEGNNLTGLDSGRVELALERVKIG